MRGGDTRGVYAVPSYTSQETVTNPPLASSLSQTLSAASSEAAVLTISNTPPAINTDVPEASPLPDVVEQVSTNEPTGPEIREEAEPKTAPNILSPPPEISATTFGVDNMEVDGEDASAENMQTGGPDFLPSSPLSPLPSSLPTLLDAMSEKTTPNVIDTSISAAVEPVLSNGGHAPSTLSPLPSPNAPHPGTPTSTPAASEYRVLQRASSRIAQKRKQVEEDTSPPDNRKRVKPAPATTRKQKGKHVQTKVVEPQEMEGENSVEMLPLIGEVPQFVVEMGPKDKKVCLV